MFILRNIYRYSSDSGKRLRFRPQHLHTFPEEQQQSNENTLLLHNDTVCGKFVYRGKKELSFYISIECFFVKWYEAGTVESHSLRVFFKTGRGAYENNLLPGPTTVKCIRLLHSDSIPDFADCKMHMSYLIQFANFCQDFHKYIIIIFTNFA